MHADKADKRIVRYVVLCGVVIVAVAFVLAISDYGGFLSLDVGINGISLTIDGR